MESRKLGEAKLLEEVFNETNTELIGNLMKGIHLDGGGKKSFYEDQARRILNAGGSIATNSAVEGIANFLYKNDYARITAIRSSMLKRSVLLKLRMRSNGKNITFEEYANALSEAVADTTNHSKNLKPASASANG